MVRDKTVTKPREQNTTTDPSRNKIIKLMGINILTSWNHKPRPVR